MDDKKFIGYIDILGFKDLVTNNSHQRLVELYEKIFSPIIVRGLAGGNVKLIDIGGKIYGQPEYSEINVNSLIVSDSIIIWTDDNSIKSFIDILACTRTLLNHSFITGFPLRGAIVEGDLKILKRSFNSSKDNSINTLIGIGLVDAYKLEEDQNWSGCLIEDQCIETYNKYLNAFSNSTEDLADINYLIKEGLITKYKIPLKTGKLQDRYAIDWVNLNNKNIFQDEIVIREKFSAYNKTVNDWRIEQIIKNTLDFIKIVMK